MSKLTLLQIVARLPCVACPLPTPEQMDWISENLAIAPRISDPHHVTSRGAGGQDTRENVMPLCRKHHNEWDAPWGGPGHMIETYSGVRIWLEEAGRQDVLDRVASKKVAKRGHVD